MGNNENKILRSWVNVRLGWVSVFIFKKVWGGGGNLKSFHHIISS
jgi:hypothetical protein